jgi:hypothetical protein
VRAVEENKTRKHKPAGNPFAIDLVEGGSLRLQAAANGVITSFLEIKLAKKYTKYIKNKLILNLGPVVPLRAISAFLKSASGFGINAANVNLLLLLAS